jgi:hypothetical protein
MTHRQKIGAIILIGALLCGVIFKFYNPTVSFLWLLIVIAAIYVEVNQNKSEEPSKTHPTLEDIRRKYPPRRSSEQIRADKLRERQAAYDRDFEARHGTKGVSHHRNYSQPIDSGKYSQLLSMLGGNRAIADRLVARYGVDKAIIDLERDRGIN